MIIPRNPWSPVIWLILWFLLFQNNPIEASEPEAPETPESIQVRHIDLHPLKDAAKIAGTCSIITSIIWAFGLTTTARYKYLGRRKTSCGDLSSNS